MTEKRLTYSRLLHRLRRVVRNDQLILAVLALVVGCIAGGAVVGFREAIDLVQWLGFDVRGERLAAHAAGLAWWHVLLVPTVGGLIVGLFVHRFMPDGRPQGVSDVIEAGSLRGGWMSSRVGLVAAAASALSIGTGASVGREGPAIHLGASLSGWIGRRLHLTRKLNRTLLGCGVAAAVAASFNAPLAGALFANEVVIGHYALKAFAPVVISSVAGTAISRLYFGDFPAFNLTEIPIVSAWEFPAFVGLGIISGFVAIILMQSMVVAGKLANESPVPTWLRPAIGGLAVGALALLAPDVLGTGYSVTEGALLAQYTLAALIVILAAKILATAISIGCGFSGGVFSPSLVCGALTGGAYGIVATMVAPELSSGTTAYTVIGMGAVAAAVLGAPISTTLIIFEMTSNYSLTLGVMIAVVIASGIGHQAYERSFFFRQLRLRGIDLKEGMESEIMRTISVGSMMREAVDKVDIATSISDLRSLLQRSATGELFVTRVNGALYGTVTLADMSDAAFEHELDTLLNAGDIARLHPPVLTLDDDMETAVRRMRETGEHLLAVVEDLDGMVLAGTVRYDDVMDVYNQALVRRRHEELGHD